MNIFAMLDMETDEVIDSAGGVPILVGRDHDGRQYIAVEVLSTPRSRTWFCAAISPRALDCLRCGRAELRDALRHTLTGDLEIVSVDQAGRFSGMILLCADLSDDVLADMGRDLSLVA